MSLVRIGGGGRLLRAAATVRRHGTAKVAGRGQGWEQWRVGSGQVASFASTSRVLQESDEVSQAGRRGAEEGEEEDSVTHNAGRSTRARKQQQHVNDRKGDVLPNTGLRFDLQSFPSLLRQPHAVYDAYERHEVPITKENPFGGSVTFFNSPEYPQPINQPAKTRMERATDAGSDDIDSGQYLQTVTPLSAREVNDLQRHLLKIRRVVQQTGKGRVARMSASVVTGNGRGMVGYGEGKDENAASATRKAFHAAVRSMDFVERHNGQTIPSEMSGKWSATQVTLRPRPPGFGLRVPPVVHAIARSAGITDLSASIIGSTNPMNVAKATLSLLWGGSAPEGLGDGIGGSLRRTDKGRGARTVQDIEMMRGRRLRPVERSPPK